MYLKGVYHRISGSILCEDNERERAVKGDALLFVLFHLGGLCYFCCLGSSLHNDTTHQDNKNASVSWEDGKNFKVSVKHLVEIRNRQLEI